MCDPIPSAGSSAPRWQRRPAERRREILDAAALVFGERGFESATLADVAERAGVSPGTVQHYFGSKAALFSEVLQDRFFVGAAEDEQLLINHRGTYAELLRELIERMWKRLSRPGSADLLLVGMASAVNHPEAGHVVSGEMATRCPRILQGVIQAGIQQGEFHPVNPEYLARAIAAGVLGMVIARQRLIRFCQDAAPPHGAVLSAFLDILEKGIGKGNRE
ncbi:MAG: TetR/AcrR family transcriptional regulator [Gemmatimonadales bacterium]